MAPLVPGVLSGLLDLRGRMGARVYLEYRANKAPLESLENQELKEARGRWAKKVTEDIQA